MDCTRRLSLSSFPHFAGAVNAYKQAQLGRLPNNSYLLQNSVFVQRRLGLWQDVGDHI